MTEHGHPTTPGSGTGEGTGPRSGGAATPPTTPSYGYGAAGPSYWTTPQAQATQQQHTAPQPPSYPGYGGYPPATAESPGEPLGSTATAPTPRRTGRLRLAAAGLVAGALIGGGAGAGVVVLVDDPAATSAPGASAQNVVIENPQTATTATAAAAKAAPSVVTVYVTSSTGAGSGSGVVLSRDGYVLTNNHVIAGDGGGSTSVQVRTADGTLYDATVVGTDVSADLAVLRLQGAKDLTPATFANSDDVAVGDVAVAIGAPLGLSNTVTDGIISATHRAVATGSTQDDATVLDALQTDAAINPGNSGGALVNAAGEVIGINTAIATVAAGVPGSQSQSGNIGVGFAIPSNTAERIAQEIIDTGSATRAVLGVRARTAADDQNTGIGTGAEIVTVEPNSAAAGAGLQAGDVITAVGDRQVTTSTELTAAIRSQAPGSTVKLTVRRGDQTRTAEVTLGSTG